MMDFKEQLTRKEAMRVMAPLLNGRFWGSFTFASDEQFWDFAAAVAGKFECRKRWELASAVSIWTKDCLEEYTRTVKTATEGFCGDRTGSDGALLAEIIKQVKLAAGTPRVAACFQDADVMNFWYRLDPKHPANTAR